MKISIQKKSFRNRLILAFLLTSVLPVLFMILFSYYNSTKVVESSVDEMTQANLQQTQVNLNVWLDSYEDVLFQIYTNDEIVRMVDEINAGQNVAVNRNAIRRYLRGLFYTKDYIQSMTLITDNGTIAFYDNLTASTSENSWQNNCEYTQDELYELISGDNRTHLLSTQEASLFAGEVHYLFHVGHRIIDYRDTAKQVGIIVISIDENLLREICLSLQEDGQNGYNSFNFIVDKKGRIVSYVRDEELAEKVVDMELPVEKRREAYRDFVSRTGMLAGDSVSIYTQYDEGMEWEIVHATNQAKSVEMLKSQQNLLFGVSFLSVLLLVAVIIVMTRHLTGSIRKVAGVMEEAGKGSLDVRVNQIEKMPTEIRIIGDSFNQMMGELQKSVKKEKEAQEQMRNAEIKALEAQINPHFLYNTLDTINWMAIDREAYDVSNAIGSLEYILRYGINNSNGIVTVQEEAEWLKQYIFLQQTRLKNTFTCEVHVEPDCRMVKIHKLLLQPFVENAILHGFENVGRAHRLLVSIRKEEKELCVRIEDNGKGIPEDVLEKIREGNLPKTSEKNHIGMENAIMRMRMYYGEKAKIRIESEVDKGTVVTLLFPVDEGEEE